MIDQPIYKFGETVFHKTEDAPGIITGILYTADGGILYQVTWQGRVTDDHFAVELTKDRPYYVRSEFGEETS
jgi:hypothetical protein